MTIVDSKELHSENITNENIILFSGNCEVLLNELLDESVDLIITSPPYCMGKAYEDPHDDIETFRGQHQRIIKDIYRVLKPGGSVCWQVGYHISEACVIPLDYLVYEIFTNESSQFANPLILRNRIIWTYGHGLNSKKRFSGRHETILWFTKGEQRIFNLDSVRVPQKYPGKRSYRGEKKGELSGNPLGKNPSDVWEIPNVKANHVEKVDHPCQFPVAIPRRLIRALSDEGNVILDPFMGSGTTGVAAVLENRKFIGAENHMQYLQIAESRIKQALDGTLKIREDIPPHIPNPNTSVARLPDEFRKAREVTNYENR